MRQHLIDTQARFAKRIAILLLALLGLSSVYAQTPFAGAAKIAAGSQHTCALTAVGGVKCWGSNEKGQLGDNSKTTRLTPVDVSGLASGVTAIAAGDAHTCALTTAGGVKCWGSNGWGQLGDDYNSMSTSLTPVDVSGLTSGVTAIAAGDVHTCALTNAGGVKCWGRNSDGQLGDNSTTIRWTPVDVTGLPSGVTAITAGNSFGYGGSSGSSYTCALTTAGGVKCWGSNGSGQLGDTTTTTRLAPVDVVGLAGGVTAISSGGYHTCALVTAGGVKCWGRNSDGQLGDTTTTTRLAPVEVAGLAGGVTAISSGGYHTCALTTTGGVKCWGDNVYGQLGNNATTNRLTLADVTGLASGVAAVAAGRDYSCALNMVGGAKCWGYNYLGMLGDNSTTTRLVPVDVKGLSSGVAAVALGNTHTCALTTMGGVKCWGWNLYGQLGDNSTTQRLTPVDVTGLASGVTAIAAGDNHTCALSTAGGVKCWGDNSRGQLGDNSTTQRMTPTDVAGLASGVTAIAAGIWHTCALTTAGRVKCWGWNGWGQLGDDSTTDRLTPVDVTGLSSGVVAISAGWYHTCALTIAGGAKCWGSNIFGQVGDNSTTTRLTPVGVTGLASGVAAIAAGGGNTCALTMAGGVRCWGLNVYAQVGDHSLANRLTPVDVTGLASSVKAIDLGDFHTCALTTAGGVKCWGANRSGQLGDNTQTQMQSTPVDVLIIGPAGPPSLPTILSIVAGGGSATINFAPPSNNGGSPISGYTATCTANGQATQSANGSSSPITVRNLTVGVVYQCTVSATNGDGFTSGASTSLPVTPRKKSSLTPILLLLLH